MPPIHNSLEHLRERIKAFAAERDWDQFHNPKNLAMALAGEAGELVEHFQWLTFDEAANLPPPRQRKRWRWSVRMCCCSCCGSPTSWILTLPQQRKGSWNSMH